MRPVLYTKKIDKPTLKILKTIFYFSISNFDNFLISNFVEVCHTRTEVHAAAEFGNGEHERLHGCYSSPTTVHWLFNVFGSTTF